MRIVVVLTLSMVLSPAMAGAGFDRSHSLWQDLVSRHVHWIAGGTGSQVDYAGFQKDRARLDQYTQSVSRVTTAEFNGWPKADQLAYLINAYNAFTVQLILTKYPELDSIKDVGSLFKSPWKKKFFSLLGEKRHLDAIEHGMIRKPGVYDDPRIHAAVNCAAIGCPALRNEAYVGSRLDAQLEDGMVRYLKARDRNWYDVDSRKLVVGKIFDWYETDFKQGHRGITSLSQFFTRYADILTDSSEGRRRIAAGQVKITFSDYNWRLNRRP